MTGITNEPKNKFVLKDNDILSVRKLLGYNEPSKVKVTGEVNYQQTVVLEFKSSTFEDIISSVGGLTKYANLESSILKRDGKIMTLDLNKIKSSDEMIFMDGDEIFIASERGVVSTVGGVENESNFIWKKGIKAKNYIKNSGGKIKKEALNSYIIYPNGKTKKINFFKNPKVLPNSIIVTNRKEIKEKDKGEFFNNFNQTFGIIASAVTTILLASKL